MKYRVFSLYEDITDGKGLAYRRTYMSNSIIKCILEVIRIIIDSNGYGGSHGWRIEYASDISRYVLDKK